jgi:hypothetical protein
MKNKPVTSSHNKLKNTDDLNILKQTENLG